MAQITKKLHHTSQENVTQAANLLKAGYVVVFPTDTVYGVGTNPFSAEGIEKLYKAKIREAEKGIPVLLADLNDLDKVTADISQIAWDLAERFWPGALTLIVPKNDALPANISPNQGIAVRIPQHDLCRELIRQAGGAVAATSANLSGRPAAQSAAEALSQLDGRVAAVLDGGLATGGVPSTIISLLEKEPLVLRQGPIKL